MSAHTHAEYRCTITTPDGVTRLITSASSFGRILSDLTLTIDDKSGELVAAERRRTRSCATRATRGTAPPTCRCSTCRRISESLTSCSSTSLPRHHWPTRSSARSARTSSTPPNALGEIPSGDVIADAQLVATQPANLGGAQIAFMNPGGIRGGADERLPLHPVGSRGAGRGHLRRGLHHPALRQQPRHQDDDRCPDPPACSSSSSSAAAARRRSGSCRSRPASATSATPPRRRAPTRSRGSRSTGRRSTAATTYRVTMNNFLASGGDGFTVFNQGTNALGGAQDIDALRGLLRLVPAQRSAEPAGQPDHRHLITRRGRPASGPRSPTPRRAAARPRHPARSGPRPRPTNRGAGPGPSSRSRGP